MVGVVRAMFMDQVIEGPSIPPGEWRAGDVSLGEGKDKQLIFAKLNSNRNEMS